MPQWSSSKDRLPTPKYLKDLTLFGEGILCLSQQPDLVRHLGHKANNFVLTVWDQSYEVYRKAVVTQMQERRAQCIMMEWCYVPWQVTWVKSDQNPFTPMHLYFTYV